MTLCGGPRTRRQALWDELYQTRAGPSTAAAGYAAGRSAAALPSEGHDDLGDDTNNECNHNEQGSQEPVGCFGDAERCRGRNASQADQCEPLPRASGSSKGGSRRVDQPQYECVADPSDGLPTEQGTQECDEVADVGTARLDAYRRRRLGLSRPHNG
jgi:hypothetical protein